MLLNLNHIGQIALPVTDVDRAEKFYENVIGWRKLYRFADLSFFDVRECVFSSRKQMSGQVQSTRLHLFPLRRHRIDGHHA